RAINQAQRGNKSGLESASSLLIDVANRRRNWARVPVCEAQLVLLEGKNERTVDQAIRHYQRAIELGERNPAVLLETIQLLREAGRGAEAYEILRMLPEQSPLLEQMKSLVVDLAVRNKDLDRAQKEAEKAVGDNPKDYRSRISLAQVHFALGKHDKAE